MKIAVVAVLIAAVFGTLFAVQNSKLLFAPRANNNSPTNVIMGPEQLVYQSNSSGLPDLPYFTFFQKDKIVGALVSWTGNYAVPNAFSPEITSINRIPTLAKGKLNTDFDRDGLWLVGAYKDPNSNITHGIYHAENYVNTKNAEDKTNYSAGYVRSFDGGVTWEKPSNNKILDGFDAPGKVGGADPGSVILLEQEGVWYLYVYYFEHTNISETRGTTVARAPIAEAGNPASWNKYYCQTPKRCGFTSPGINGNFTKLPGLEGQTSVAYNDYLKKFLAISGGPMTNRNVAQFKVSSDGLNFTNFGPASPLGPIYPSQNWIRVYVSQVADDKLPGHTGQNFYIYYVTLNMNTSTGFPNAPRYMFRREVTLFDDSVPTFTPSPAPTKVPTPIVTPTPPPTALGDNFFRLYNSKIKAHFYTLSADESKAAQAIDYILEGICCKISKTQGPNTIPLLQVETSTDIFLESNREQIRIAEGLGYKNRKTVGYCFSNTNPPVGTMPLYRFYSSADTDHFYTASETEKDLFLGNKSWAYEGVVCHVGAR